jgi:hypothetical protein
LSIARAKMSVKTYLKNKPGWWLPPEIPALGEVEVGI